MNASVRVVADCCGCDGTELRRRLQQVVEDVDDRVDGSFGTSVLVLQVRAQTTCVEGAGKGFYLEN